jgi:CDP-glycerol glycerophosphotransferase
MMSAYEPALAAPGQATADAAGSALFPHSSASAGTAVPAWFDSAFYLAQNPDVAASGAAPYPHFRAHGWRQFRNPSTTFDLWWYWAWHLGSDLSIDPAAHYEQHGRDAGLHTGHPPGERLEAYRKTAFNVATLALFKRLEADAATFARIAANLARMEQWDLADMFAVRACALEPGSASHQALLAGILFRRGGWRRAIEPLRKATALEPGRADWLHDLGHASERLDWLDEAVDAYAKALQLEPDRFDTLYRLGNVHAKRGEQQAAAAAHTRLEALDPEVAALGVGALHQRNGDWVAARDAYAQRLRTLPADAALHHAHGFALEMLLDWEAAAEAYAHALALDDSDDRHHYRLACVLERQERHAEAAAGYAHALERGDPDPDRYYRLGLCLFRAGRLEAAIDAWRGCLAGEDAVLPSVPGDDAGREARLARLQEALSRCIHDADAHFELGTIRERQGELPEAAAAYRQAALRRSEFSARDHYRLGLVLARLGQTQAACEAFVETRLYKRDFSHLPQPQTADIKFEYAEFLDTLAIAPRTVLYESNHGNSINCNPLAVFRQARRRFAGAGWLHVWVVRSGTAVPEELATMADVVLVRHGSSAYLRHLASAGWLVNNTTFPPYFVRRVEQRYLNTWHGTPIKSLGRDVHGSLFDHRNVSRNLLQVTHLAVQNRHTHETLLRSNDVAAVYGGRIAETGHARVDFLVSAGADARAAIRRRLGVAEGVPLVLYAPTYRGEVHTPSFDDGVLAAAVAALSRHPVALVFNAHPFVARQLAGKLPEGVLSIPPGMDITELLAAVDVLVTDYSSILFDFLPTRRPVVLYAPDLERYRAERGMYLPLESLPARLCRDRAGLEAAMGEALAGAVAPGKAAAATLAAYCPRDDGNAAERAVAFFFDDASEAEVPNPRPARTNLLFHAGNFNTNGVTTSFTRLVSQLDPERFSSTVVVDPWNLESYPQRLDRYAELPDGVQRWARMSYPVGCLEDQWLHNRLGTPAVAGERAQRRLALFFQREYRRQFGDARIDAAIDFAGYTPFWTALFGQGRPAGTRAIAYLHNDMQQEIRTRLPSLRKVFEQYRHCDALVSVSASLHRINAENLAACAGVDRHPFTHADNCIDPARIRRDADAALPDDLLQWRGSRSALLGTVGRLSPEKGHARLVDAFAALHAEDPGLGLVIAGEGAERAALLEQVGRLGLDDAVRLTGALDNPFPLIREMDLFVLSSFYEGQAIVLLEALALGTPALSTDVPGPSSVLAGGAGILVENSTAGLIEGMRRWLQERPPAPAWDAEAYRDRALAQFAAIVGHHRTER